MLERGDVEAAEMIKLHPRGVAQQRLEVGRGIVAARGEAHQMLVRTAVRQLHDAQPIARRDESHRLGIDGDRRAGREQAGGDVFLVQVNGHRAALDRSRAPLNGRSSCDAR